MKNNTWFSKNITKRKLIRKDEAKISYIQALGFVLIFSGVIYMTIYRLLTHASSGEGMAISFFIIMLGISLAFPSLLEGYNKDISTMRIVVFMMINVICLLLIKIGWDQDIKTLEDIGLDEYWMGVIAFVFGAKATQSFFESKMAILGKEKILFREQSSDSEVLTLPTADKKVIEEALEENGEYWVSSFPYVTGFSIRNKITEEKELDRLALIFKVTRKVKVLEFGHIPEFIKYTTKDGKGYKILTDVLEEKMPTASTMIIEDEQPFPLGNSISRRNFLTTGSIGLIVHKSNVPNTNYLVSCYHILCAPELKENNKTFSAKSKPQPLSCASKGDKGTNHIGNVIFGVLDKTHDFAIAKVKDGITLKNEIKLTNKTITPKSFGGTSEGEFLILCGRSSGVRIGRVKSNAIPQTIDYGNNTTQYIQNLIEVEKFSNKGDSGGIVINERDKVVGLLIADSNTFSYVLPVNKFITDNNYSL